MGYEGSEEHFTFEDVVATILFLVALWLAGKACEYIQMPGLIGEIIVGSILGPHLANFAPEPLAFMMIGEIGLILLVVEAGLELDLAVAKQSGSRGLLIGCMGSFIPLGIGFSIATGLGMEWKSALAIGACFGPTSMGVALVVLKKGGVLNTPMGQVVVAAAVADDVLALIILSELKALLHPSPIEFIAPVLSAVGNAFVIGYVAVVIIPAVLPKHIHKIDHRYVDDVLLGIMVFFVIALMCILNYSKGSYLFGAFLGGLCFCTERDMIETWHHQVKRIQRWLLRMFFGCTVGFQVPIDEFWTGRVIGRGFLFFLCVLGKMSMGFFAQPLTLNSFLTVGASMSTWGEFAFVIAVEAKGLGLIHADDYASVIFAVLLSIIISPYALSLIISYGSKEHDQEIDALVSGGGELNNYYKLYVRVSNVWGLQPDIIRIFFNQGLKPIEFRCDIMEDGYVMYEAYLMDEKLKNQVNDGVDHTVELAERLTQLRAVFSEYLGAKEPGSHDYGVDVDDFDHMIGFALVRWVPGNTEEEKVELAVDEDKARKVMAAAGFRSSNNLFKEAEDAMQRKAALKANTFAVKGFSRQRRHSVDEDEIETEYFRRPRLGSYEVAQSRDAVESGIQLVPQGLLKVAEADHHPRSRAGSVELAPTEASVLGDIVHAITGATAATLRIPGHSRYSLSHDKSKKFAISAHDDHSTAAPGVEVSTSDVVIDSTGLV